MNNFKETLAKYAKLAVRTGVNLQEGQALLINAPVEGAEFTRLVVKEAYEAGAKNVQVVWMDDTVQYLGMKHNAKEVLENFPEWRVKMLDSFAEDGAAVLNILSSNPDLLKDIDPNRIAMFNKAAGTALENYRRYLMNDRIPWSIVAIPSEAWAQKVFPNLEKEKAIEELWEKIFYITRVDQEDPLKAWEDHNQKLLKIREHFNKKQYQKLIYQAPGTDLTIELPKRHIWGGGISKTESGTPFNPNIPTEEVYTLPHKNGVNGTVKSTKPLSYSGQLIDNFSLTFKDGEVIEYSAETGYDALKQLLETDEGAKHLGEVALVPHQSPISQSNIIFFSTLFDENASCHLALGEAYPTNLEGGESLSQEELAERGANTSMTHVDFMIGSADLNIDAITQDGEKEPIFRNGNWAFTLE